MVCLRTFGTPHARTYGYDLGFLWAIGFLVGLGGGRGVVENRGKFVWYCILVTVANFDIGRCFAFQRTHLKVSTRVITLPSAFPVLGSTYCFLLDLTEFNDFTKHKITNGFNNLKLVGSPVVRRDQISSVSCFIYLFRTSIKGLKLLKLTGRFEAILSALPNLHPTDIFCPSKYNLPHRLSTTPFSW
jgi:hypothetical protein